MCDLNQLIFFVLENILFDLVFWKKKKNWKHIILIFAIFGKFFILVLCLKNIFLKLFSKMVFGKGFFKE